MTEEQRIELLMILSRFEGFIMASNIHDKFVNNQLDTAVAILDVVSVIIKPLEGEQ